MWPFKKIKPYFHQPSKNNVNITDYYCFIEMTSQSQLLLCDSTNKSAKVELPETDNITQLQGL